MRDYIDDVAEFLATGRDIGRAIASGSLNERAVYAVLNYAVEQAAQDKSLPTNDPAT